MALKIALKLFFTNFEVSASVLKNICEEWIKDISVLLKGYKPKNTFNTDEMGLFYQCLSVMLKDEECRDRKQSKVWLIVLLITNEDG